MVNEKAFDATGQMYFDIFDFDGFLGDVIASTWPSKPYFEVEHRKYRFPYSQRQRLFFRSAVSMPQAPPCRSSRSPTTAICFADAGDLTQLDEQGIARTVCDIVIDFTAAQSKVGDKFWLVNLCEHQDGKKPSRTGPCGRARGQINDPCVGKFRSSASCGIRPQPIEAGCQRH
jgi:hypothetical protein